MQSVVKGENGIVSLFSVTAYQVIDRVISSFQTLPTPLCISFSLGLAHNEGDFIINCNLLCLLHLLPLVDPQKESFQCQPSISSLFFFIH